MCIRDRLPGVLDQQRDLGLVAVPEQMAQRHQPARRGLHRERAAEARAEQMPQVTLCVGDRAVVAQRQGRRGAAVVHLAGGGQIAGVGAADGDFVALGQRQHIPPPRHPLSEPGIQIDQGAHTGELGGRERQLRPFDGERAPGGVAELHEVVLQYTLGGYLLGERLPGQRARGHRTDRAAPQQLPQCEREFGGIQGRTGGHAQHPGRRIDQIVGIGPLQPRVRAARSGDRTGQLLGNERVRRAQQEFIDRAIRERVGLEAEYVHTERGQCCAQRGQAARLVADRGPHPPQHRLRSAGPGGRGGGRRRGAGIGRWRGVFVAA